MADSASELESDASSVDGSLVQQQQVSKMPEQVQKRIQSLQQENTVLKMELETYKLKCKNLQEENKELRQASVNIQARAEQEEEFISNTLLKKIQSLKNEKETLARNYEQEEEFLTNDLSRKLMQLRQEKCELEQTLEKEQEYQVNKLMRKIEKLEAETLSKQSVLEQLRREKVELENSLEQEQEALVNRLWKRMDKLEAEKRMLQEKLDQPVSEPPSPKDIPMDGDLAGNLSQHIKMLRGEVVKLRTHLFNAQADHQSKMAKFQMEEKQRREENLKLQRRLQMEIERREQLCRHLSESESSLEMDDERHFNEMSKEQERLMSSSFSSSSGLMGSHMHHRGSDVGHPTVVRPRTVSSPIPVQSPSGSRAFSPAGMHYGSAAAFSPPSPMHHGPSSLPDPSPVFSHMQHAKPSNNKASHDRFVKPMPPPSSPSQPPHSPMSESAPSPAERTVSPK